MEFTSNLTVKAQSLTMGVLLRSGDEQRREIYSVKDRKEATELIPVVNSPLDFSSLSLV